MLKSPILDELRTSRLNIYGATDPPPPPTPKVPKDYFAVVATTEVTLGDGDYVLSTTFDDGVRVWLDNEVMIEYWGPNSPTTKSVTIGGKRGAHIIKVEFIQIEGRYALDVGLSVHEDAKEKLAKRKANAAVALLRMHQPENVWPLLKHSPDPSVRSYLIHRLGPSRCRCRVDPQATRRANRTSPFAGRSFSAWGSMARRTCRSRIANRSCRSSRRCTARRPIPAFMRLANGYCEPGSRRRGSNRSTRTGRRIKSSEHNGWTSSSSDLANDKEKVPPQWYVNGQGQMMVVIPGPVEFVMGSPPTEAGRQDHEMQHKERISRTFALAAKPVTVEQFRQFEKGIHASARLHGHGGIPGRGHKLVHGGEILQLAEQGRGDSRRSVVLRRSKATRSS